MMPAARGPLADKGIVVTRPAHQSERLAAELDAAGARAIIFPTIEILPPADPQALDSVIDRLERFDIAVFISPNAARMALQAIIARRNWPASVKAATIGRGGERELARHGIGGVIAPAQFDSEGLLGMPAMQAVAGRRVAIFRGDGGRELLGDTLRARGAVVEYVESYRRALPQADAAPLLKEWAGGDIDAVTVTSSEGLRNLCVLIGTTGLEHLKRTPLFVPHPRIELAAKDAGCTHIVVTQQGDDGLIAGLAAWFGSAHLHD